MPRFTARGGQAAWRTAGSAPAAGYEWFVEDLRP